MIRRRGLLLGLLAAPAVVRSPGLLMPVSPQPRTFVVALPMERDTSFFAVVEGCVRRVSMEEFDRLFGDRLVRNLRVAPGPLSA